MTIAQKQVFESSFNFLGLALTEAFEKAQKRNDIPTMKKLNNYIECVKQMYTYTNLLETELIIEKSKNDTTTRRKRVRQK